jgi:hypothetical protein
MRQKVARSWLIAASLPRRAGFGTERRKTERRALGVVRPEVPICRAARSILDVVRACGSVHIPEAQSDSGAVSVALWSVGLGPWR